MKIPEWPRPDNQMSQLGRHHWSVSRLIELSRGLPVMEVSIDHISVDFIYDRLRLRELVMHMKAAQEADLNCPIILDEDGSVMDGRHRIMKAILNGHSTIKAVRFDENPSPCRVDG